VAMFWKRNKKRNINAKKEELKVED